MLIDTHCHLNETAFRETLPEVIARARDAGVGACIVPAYDRQSLARTADISEQYPDYVFPAYGIHPWYGVDFALDEVKEFLLRSGTVAVGEIGLDFSPDRPPAGEQLELFQSQLALAAELGLPVLIHCRKAHEQLLKTLAGFKGRVSGVLHSFSGGRELALRFIELGFHIGFSGSVTRSNAKKYHKTAAGIPLESILLETDAPSIATESTVASQVEPRHVREVAEKIAALRDVSFDEIARATTANARQLFGIKNLNI